MKKIIATALVFATAACMAVPAFAVTPKLEIDMPEISNIKIDVKLDDGVAENAVQNWLKDHPFTFDWSAFRVK